MDRKLVGWGAVLVLCGCQAIAPVHPTPSPGVASQATDTASLTIRISLPREAQALPSNTQSVKVLLRKTGLADRTASVNTGTATTVTFSSLPPGAGYTLYAASYTGLAGAGTMLSWGQLPLTLASGLNSATFGLSVAIRSGAGADDLVAGPAGKQAQLLGGQRSFTSMQELSAGTPTNLEVFYPGQFAYLGQFGTYGAGSGQFYLPEGIAVDTLGNLYVADRFNHRIQKFNPNGTFIRGWGQGQIWTTTAPATASGTANGWFNEPVGVSVDPGGFVWVADRLNARVLKFDQNGNFLMGAGHGQAWFPGTAAPVPAAGTANGHFSANLHGLTHDANGNVYVADVYNWRIVKLSADGRFLMGLGNGTTWGPTTPAPVPVQGSGNGVFNGGHAVELDAQGNLYVAETTNNRIQKFSPTGSYLAQFPHTDTYGTIVSPFGGLVSVAPFNGATNGIDLLDASGNALSRIGTGGTGNAQFKNIRLMRFSPDGGTLWVSDGENHRIQRFRGLTAGQMTDSQGGLRLAGNRQPGPSIYAGSGTYDTPPIDAGTSTAWASIFWNVALRPANTGVATAVATSSNGLTWDPWVPVAGSSALGHNTANLTGVTARFLRIRVTLQTTDTSASPEVQDVGVTY